MRFLPYRRPWNVYQLSLFSNVLLKGMLGMQEVIHALETQVCHLQQQLGSQIQQAEQRRLPKVQMVSCSWSGL